MPANSILVVNAGSSSVKFQVFSIGTDNGLSPFLKGSSTASVHVRAARDGGRRCRDNRSAVRSG